MRVVSGLDDNEEDVESPRHSMFVSAKVLRAKNLSAAEDEISSCILFVDGREVARKKKGARFEEIGYDERTVLKIAVVTTTEKLFLRVRPHCLRRDRDRNAYPNCWFPLTTRSSSSSRNRCESLSDSSDDEDDFSEIRGQLQLQLLFHDEDRQKKTPSAHRRSRFRPPSMKRLTTAAHFLSAMRTPRLSSSSSSSE